MHLKSPSGPINVLVVNSDSHHMTQSSPSHSSLVSGNSQLSELSSRASPPTATLPVSTASTVNSGNSSSSSTAEDGMRSPMCVPPDRVLTLEDFIQSIIDANMTAQDQEPAVGVATEDLGKGVSTQCDGISAQLERVTTQPDAMAAQFEGVLTSPGIVATRSDNTVTTQPDAIRDNILQSGTGTCPGGGANNIAVKNLTGDSNGKISAEQIRCGSEGGEWVWFWQSNLYLDSRLIMNGEWHATSLLIVFHDIINCFGSLHHVYNTYTSQSVIWPDILCSIS